MKFARLVFLFVFLPSFAFSDVPEKEIVSATPIKVEVALPSEIAQSTYLSRVTFSEEELASNPILTKRLLNQAIEANQTSQIKNLLKIYRTFPTNDPILIMFAEAKLAKSHQDYSSAIALLKQILEKNPELNPVRIELGMILFLDRQDNQAKKQFETVMSDPKLPPDIAQLVSQYLSAVKERNSWQVSLDGGYLREQNVNNVSKASYIENTRLMKGESMLPQKAHGLQYSFDISRNINLFDSHYLHFKNSLYGKSYWDNHQYNDITNRTYLGYRHQSAKSIWSLLPFYEQQWYGGHRYKHAIGLRAEIDYWLSPRWQLSSALERSKSFYKNTSQLDGYNALLSFTAVWRFRQDQFLFSGVDYSIERTQARHYAYDFKALRLGWGKDWKYGISTRFSGRIAKRQYKDDLVLGSVLYFNKAREDKIYSLNATLWKRDWNILGITPKLQFSWKKQKSNFDSLYSYIDRNVNILIEKDF